MLPSWLTESMPGIQDRGSQLEGSFPVKFAQAVMKLMQTGTAQALFKAEEWRRT